MRRSPGTPIVVSFPSLLRLRAQMATGALMRLRHGLCAVGLNLSRRGHKLRSGEQGSAEPTSLHNYTIVLAQTITGGVSFHKLRQPTCEVGPARVDPLTWHSLDPLC